MTTSANIAQVVVPLGMIVPGRQVGEWPYRKRGMCPVGNLWLRGRRRRRLSRRCRDMGMLALSPDSYGL